MRFLRGGPSRLGNIFIGIGLLLLLAVPATYIWTELQGALLQAQLRSEVPAAGTSVPLAVPSPSGEAVPAAAAQLALPSQAPVAATATPAPLSGATLPSIKLPAASATATATATPSPVPSPTFTPTAVPPGPPVRIVFSDLHIDSAVSEMGWHAVRNAAAPTEWSVPENTAGWAISSAPLGVAGNVVLSGHNNIYGMVFRPISLAWPENSKRQLDAATFSTDILNGRLIELFAADGRRFDYQVTGFYRLHDSGVTVEQRQVNADYMQPTADPELTLITCWPPWSNTYRLVVRAKIVPQ